MSLLTMMQSGHPGRMVMVGWMFMNDIGEWWHQHERERENWLQERLNLITVQITPIT